MGKPTGFVEIARAKQPVRPVAERVRDWHEVYLPHPTETAARAGRAVHGLRHPVLPRGLPARQPHSRLERPRLPRSLAERDRAAARDQQLPGVHGTPVPRAVRGLVRARHQQRRGDDQGDRERDHRARVRGRLDRRRPAVAAAHRQARRRGGLRTGGSRGGRPAEPRGAPGDRVRAGRSHRRAAALRHSRVQARKDGARTPARG